MYFCSGYAEWLCGHVPWEEGFDTCIPRSSIIYPNSRLLIENPLAKSNIQKNLKKVNLMNLLQWKNALNYF